MILNKIELFDSNFKTRDPKKEKEKGAFCKGLDLCQVPGTIIRGSCFC